MAISNKEAAAIVIREAKRYDADLANNRFIIVYRDRVDNKLKHIEVDFLPKNFQHLTGVLLKDKKTNKAMQHTSEYFYKRCIEGRLSGNDILFSDHTTIDLKLQALPLISQMVRITRMVGEYDDSKENLDSDYIIGGTNACIGVSKYPDGSVYFPRTCLFEDIRKISIYTSQVLLIYRKELPIDDKIDADLKYVAKGIDVNKIVLPKEIRSVISSVQEMSDDLG